MLPRETPGEGERGDPLPALGRPEVSSLYCKASHVPLTSAPLNLWPLPVPQSPSTC